MTTENIARNPCPNCGGETRIVFCLHPGTAYVEHEKCKFKGPEVKVLNGMSDTDIESRAVDAWNSLLRVER
jgi:hypothetical protein